MFWPKSFCGQEVSANLVGPFFLTQESQIHNSTHENRQLCCLLLFLASIFLYVEDQQEFMGVVVGQ